MVRQSARGRHHAFGQAWRSRRGPLLEQSAFALGLRATKDHALDLLREAGSGERLVVEMSTENLVANEDLLALTSVLEQAELPLTREKIDRIAESVRG